MRTITELEKYLEENCFSFSELTIGKHYAPEGIIIEENQGKYEFSYAERGNKTCLKSFSTEEELVHYSLQELLGDPWSNAHIVAFTFDKEEIITAERHLQADNIVFKRNDVPNYRAGQTAYRIFVFGKDILRLTDFKQKYFHH